MNIQFLRLPVLTSANWTTYEIQHSEGRSGHAPVSRILFLPPRGIRRSFLLPGWIPGHPESTGDPAVRLLPGVITLRWPGRRPVSPVLSCSARGLPSLPGCPWGAVSFYLPVSPLPAGPWSRDRCRLAVCFLWHFPWPGTLSPRSPGLRRARCLAESGLSSHPGFLRNQAGDHPGRGGENYAHLALRAMGFWVSRVAGTRGIGIPTPDTRSGRGSRCRSLCSGRPAVRYPTETNA